jgi:phage portal protein BeeE
MGILQRLTGRETRSQEVKTSDPYLGEFFNLRGSGAVDVARAASQPVAYACRNLIARSLASVPCKLYRHLDDGGRRPATEHPLYTALQFTMAPGLTAFNGREWLIHSLTQYRNALAKIERNGRGQVTSPFPWIGPA